MITATAYSKDPNIVPEGIVITFGKDMIKAQGGEKLFLSQFLKTMATDGNYWMHKCKNLPTVDIDYIYIIVLNRLWGRVYNGGLRRNPTNVTGWTANNKPFDITWNFITLAGPFEKCPFKRVLKGFQGFRYCTKLF